MAEREPGFYWVKTVDCHGREDWIVAQWIVTSAGLGWWSCCGNDGAFDDDYFSEIGERVAPKDALLLIAASMRLERQLLGLLSELRTEYIGEANLLAVIDAAIELGECIKPMPDLTKFMENKNG